MLRDPETASNSSEYVRLFKQKYGTPPTERHLNDWTERHPESGQSKRRGR
jgi:hypothetical protein